MNDNLYIWTHRNIDKVLNHPGQYSQPSHSNHFMYKMTSGFDLLSYAGMLRTPSWASLLAGKLYQQKYVVEHLFLCYKVLVLLLGRWASGLRLHKEPLIYTVSGTVSMQMMYAYILFSELTFSLSLDQSAGFLTSLPGGYFFNTFRNLFPLRTNFKKSKWAVFFS